MSKKFLDTLEKYIKELGLNEAVIGSTNVMTPPVTSSTGGQPNIGNITIDDLAKQEQDHIKTTNDINSRIQSGNATPEDYTALQAATTSLSQIQQAKAKLSPQKPGTPISSSTNNPLVKPLT